MSEDGPAGRVAIVTGAGQGIGLAVVQRLRASGVNVVGFDLKNSDVVCDVTEPEQVRECVHAVTTAHGRLDILVNNAGGGTHTLPQDLSPAEMRAVYELNVGGYFYLAQAAFATMSGTGGAIVNVSSTAGSSALGRGNLAFSMCKAAVEQMTRELAVEWAWAGIRVNAVAPCQVRTPGFSRLLSDQRIDNGKVGERMLRGIPLGRLAEAEDVAAAVQFLASEQACFVTGVVLPVDGGNLALNAGGTIGADQHGGPVAR